jgi:PAS domain S-box-containing protein
MFRSPPGTPSLDGVPTDAAAPDATAAAATSRDVPGPGGPDGAADPAARRAAWILERVGDAHLTLDRDFRFTEVNPAAERLLGRSRGELLGRSHWDVFPASADSDAGRAYRRVVAEGVEQHLAQHHDADGDDLHVEIDAYPAADGGTAVFLRDVTARVRAEAERDRALAAERAARAAAERERARLAEVLGALPAGVALTDGPAHRFVLANAAYRATVGGRDVVGRTPEEAFPDLAGQGFHEAVARVYATGSRSTRPRSPRRSGAPTARRARWSSTSTWCRCATRPARSPACSRSTWTRPSACAPGPSARGSRRRSAPSASGCARCSCRRPRPSRCSSGPSTGWTSSTTPTAA